MELFIKNCSHGHKTLFLPVNKTGCLTLNITICFVITLVMTKILWWYFQQTYFTFYDIWWHTDNYWKWPFFMLKQHWTTHFVTLNNVGVKSTCGALTILYIIFSTSHESKLLSKVNQMQILLKYLEYYLGYEWNFDSILLEC